MFNCMSPKSEEEILSKKIELSIKDHSKSFDNAIKILLLGTGESGKTTIIKQMKILHINGFSNEERIEKASEIRQNIQEAMNDLIIHTAKLGIKLDSEENKVSANYIIQFGKQIPSIDEEYTYHIKKLWTDSGIKECYRRSNEFQLIDSAKYFLDRLDDVCDSTFLPSTDDILHSRKMTTGIHEITFNVKIPKYLGGGSQEFRMFDVGGQRDQRCKWMQVFDGVEAILFIMSCGDFDQTLREDIGKNRLAEAIELFSLVWHNRFLMNSGLIVFLNKQDILKEKVMSGKSIGDYFPAYKSYANKDSRQATDEVSKTKVFIQNQLENITKERPSRVSRLTAYAERTCFYHYTVATDTDNIKTVFSDVHEMIIRINLGSVGLK